MTGIHEIRYTLEHRMLPGWFYGEGQRLTELLTERPLFVYEVLCDILKKEGLENPYRGEDFETERICADSSVDEKITVLKLTLSEPEDAPLCYRIYMIYNDGFTHVGYFTVEKGNGPVADDRHFLCSWDLQMHLNHGCCLPEEELQRVLALYRQGQ